MTIGEIIKKLRFEKGITQQELADELKISRSNIANYENDSNLPSLDILIKLTKFFNISADYLLEDYDIEDEKATNKEETKGTENTYTNDIMDYELAKKMMQVLLDFEKPISTKRAYKIIDIAKSMVLDLAIIYYKD